jgi:LCCL domain
MNKASAGSATLAFTLALGVMASHPARADGPATPAPTKVATADWSTQANSLKGSVGERFELTCPANGTLSDRLWGTELYTDDSSICTAAVQSELITTAKGGTVIIEIRAGAASYRGSTRNTVVSRDYGQFGGSFAFVRSSGETAPVLQGTVSFPAATWATQANGLHGAPGAKFSLTCPAGGPISNRLWGTDRYTDDSSICTAAVHAGLITLSKGGKVTIQLAAGATSYKGSTRNGVTSQDYGSWGGSFSFVKS